MPHERRAPRKGTQNLSRKIGLIALAAATSLGENALFAAANGADAPQLSLRNWRAPVQAAREAVPGFVWLEAEGFRDYGKWHLDTQFVHKMGSAYLLAAAVGTPVKDAATSFDVPRAGTWHAWARTKDWVPAHSPGKFALAVNGRESPVLGASGKPGWRWERAGAYDLAAGPCEVRLVDKSGWFGRCDAVLFTTDAAYVPPEAEEPLARERRRLLGQPWSSAWASTAPRTRTRTPARAASSRRRSSSARDASAATCPKPTSSRPRARPTSRCS